MVKLPSTDLLSASANGKVSKMCARRVGNMGRPDCFFVPGWPHGPALARCLPCHKTRDNQTSWSPARAARTPRHALPFDRHGALIARSSSSNLGQARHDAARESNHCPSKCPSITRRWPSAGRASEPAAAARPHRTLNRLDELNHDPNADQDAARTSMRSAGTFQFPARRFVHLHRDGGRATGNLASVGHDARRRALRRAGCMFIVCLATRWFPGLIAL